MDNTKFIYAGGENIRASCRKPPKYVPKCDVIRLTLDKNGHREGGFTAWLKPDEATAIASCLTAAVWRWQIRELVKKLKRRKTCRQKTLR